MPNEERGRLDSAIDRAVRGMMQVDPPPGLRHRVAGRIEAGSRRSWMIPALGALAAAVVLILAVVSMSTPELASVPEPSVVSAPPATPSEPPPQALAATSQPTPPAVMPEQRSRPAARTGRASADSIFGERTGRVSATNVQGTRDKPTLTGQAPPHEPEPAGQRINIKLDLTFTEHVGSGEPARKVVTMVVADRGAGSVRSTGSVRSQGRVQIHVDARPQILESGDIQLTLALEYTPRTQSNDGLAESSTLNEQITTVLQPGKPLVVSQAADPASDRRIIVEVKASVMK